MEITREQQKSLVEEVMCLIDENLENTRVLERARPLAVAVFGILSRIDDDSQSVGFALQDYAYNCLQASKGDQGASAWIEENRQSLSDAMSAKFDSYS